VFLDLEARVKTSYKNFNFVVIGVRLADREIL